MKRDLRVLAAASPLALFAADAALAQKAGGIRLLHMLITSSRQFFEQRLRLFQIGGVEPLGEPAEDRREQLAGFGVAALVAAEPGKAHGGPQFPELCFLLPGDAESFAIQFLGGRGMRLQQ